MTNIVFRAMEFAQKAHQTQVRKYTEEPYFVHLAEVAAVYGAYAPGDYDGISMCWLHDTIEDTSKSLRDLEMVFGYDIARGVYALTNTEIGNRAERVAQARVRLSLTTQQIQNIKTCDLLSNTRSIMRCDPKFAVVYIQEKRELLAAMKKVSPELRALAEEQIK